MDINKLKQLRKGIEAEGEHKEITGGDKIKQANIALDHLKEIPDYYTRLEKMENKAEKEKGNKEEKRKILFKNIKK